MLTLLLVVYSMLFSFPRINMVKASGTIYIRANGAVEPPTPLIHTGDNVTYTFTGDVYNPIVIEKSNTTIDGNGSALQGSGNGNGFSLGSVTNVTIQNTNVQGFICGVYITDSSNHSLLGNNVINNYWGVWVNSSCAANISGNNIVGNRDGIYLSNSSNCIVSGNNIANRDYGVCLGVSFNNIVSGNNITDNLHAVHFFESPNNNIVSGNNITSNSFGIYFSELSNNNVIIGNNIIDNHWGVYSFLYPSSNTISGNNMSNNYYAIYIFASTNNTISGNVMNSNRYNFDVEGYEMQHFLHYIDVSNLVDGKPVYYWVNRHRELVPLDASYVALVNCTEMTVRNITVTDNMQGLLLAYTRDSYITNNTITNNYKGICVCWSSYNEISGNNVTKNEFGVWLQGSLNNTFHHNNFIDNTCQIDTFDSKSVWDSGYPLGGNYWSGYAGFDSNLDAIGDTAYLIHGNDIDNYPLMGLFFSFNTSLGYCVDVISNSTVEGFQYFESNSTVKIYVSNSSTTQTHGFCRICVPHTLMNVSNIAVIIDNGLTSVLYNNYTLYDNGTYRWIYFAYENTAHEICVVPEFHSRLILPLLMTATVLAVIVYRKTKCATA